jgi:CheY-like chemotaxis protein
MTDLTGRRIFVLEEDEPVAAVLAAILKDLGCETVGPASRIDDAIALAITEPIDAAILDVAIRGEVSFAVADELVSRGVPYAFVSGNKTPASIRRYAPVSIITKPYSAEHIRQILSELIENANA